MSDKFLNKNTCLESELHDLDLYLKSSKPKRFTTDRILMERQKRISKLMHQKLVKKDNPIEDSPANNKRDNDILFHKVLRTLVLISGGIISIKALYLIFTGSF